MRPIAAKLTVDETPVTWEDRYAWSVEYGVPLLSATAAVRHTTLIRRVAGMWSPPFIVVYLLYESGIGAPQGRYRYRTPMGLPELSRFLAVNKEFLEADGRHALKIEAVEGEGVLEYARNGVVTVAGDDLMGLVRRLDDEGFVEGEIETSDEAVYGLWPDYNGAEAAIVTDTAWERFPL